MKFKLITDILAQIEAEILFQQMAIFFADAKERSKEAPFVACQKKTFAKKIVAESWISFSKN